jgi:hypothetical protein
MLTKGIGHPIFDKFAIMKYILIIVVCLVSLSANAQSEPTLNPNVATNSDSSSIKTPTNDSLKANKTGFFSFLKETGYTPKKAAFYSAVFPGGGQIYNRQYWKAPLALGAVGAAGYFLYDNTTQYRRFRDAYRLRVDGDPTTIDEFANTPNATAANLVEIRDQYRKWMEQSYIAVGVVYGLQVLEAYTAAHLKNFDIDDDLSINWQPTMKIPVGIPAFNQRIFDNTSQQPASNVEFGIKMRFVRNNTVFITDF